MRDIKFRAKRVDNGEWVYGNYVKAEYLNSKEKYEHYIIEVNADGQTYLVNKDTVSQFIGRKDINGKEIYENDIVKITYLIEIKNSTTSKEYTEKSEFIGVVKNDLLSGLYINYICDNSNVSIKQILELGVSLEIVGNIFDNPGLLGEQQ